MKEIRKSIFRRKIHGPSFLCLMWDLWLPTYAFQTLTEGLGVGDTNLAASLRCQSGNPLLSTPKGFKAVREGGSVLGRMILIIIPTPFTT